MLSSHKFDLVKFLSIAFLILFLILSFNSVYAVDYEDMNLTDQDSNFNEVSYLDDSYLNNSYSNDSFLDNSDINNSNGEDSNLNHSKNVLSQNSLGLSKSKVILTTSNLSASFKTKNFTAKLTDSNKNPIVGAKVSFTISSKTYNKTTDKDGIARLMINLYPGKYNITSKFEGNENYSSAVNKNSIQISKKKITLTSSNLAKKYGNSDSFQVKLSDNGIPVSDVKIALKILSKTYYKITNANGIASLAINLQIGKYVINSSLYNNKAYYSNANSNNITVISKNPYNLTVLKWGSKANIKNNKVLINNLPKSSLTNKIVAACNNGTPLIQFGNGSGKKVFILAGVHGNELSSQIAAFKLINSIYNSKTKLNGTVYIVPVLCPKSTANNQRYYNDVNLNSVADKKGTLSYKLVSYAKNLKVDVLGDFHCTRPGGDPGKNVAMGTSSPTASSAKLAKYIAKTTGYSSLIYKKAGEEYPGAVEDVLNLAGITSVTCEVVTPHGKVASGSPAKSLIMMKALLKYYGISV